MAAPYRSTVTIDGNKFDAVSTSVVFNTLKDKAGMPEMGSLNTSIRVWVDLHTALYYCPDSDLYGKTSKGRFTTQRDAQLDQFEPAYRKACD